MRENLRPLPVATESELIGLEALFRLKQLSHRGILQPGLAEYLPSDDLSRRRVVEAGKLLTAALGEHIPILEIAEASEENPEQESARQEDYPAGEKALKIMRKMVEDPLPPDLTTVQVKRFVSRALSRLPTIVSSNQLDLHSTVLQFYLRIDGVSDKQIDAVINPFGKSLARARRHLAIEKLHKGGYPPSELRKMLQIFLSKAQLEVWSEELAKEIGHTKGQ